MAFKSYRKESRDNNYGTSSGESLTNEQINLGCNLRIADALETIAQDKKILESEIKHLQSSNDFLRIRRDQLLDELKSVTASRNTYRSLYNKTKTELSKLKQ
ncbi:MAG TPA: hypothetical protein VGN20_19210 [Mucilaginibacter sp.]|jgi:hypothetical protein